MFKLFISFITAVLFTLGTITVKAQGTNLCPAGSKKAVKLFEEAKSAKKSKEDYKIIWELLEESAEEDTGYAEPVLMMGDLAYAKKDFVNMKKSYKRLIEICPDASANAYFRLGAYLFETKNYPEAVGYLKSYIDFGTEDETKNKQARTYMFRADMIAHPVPFNPVLLKGISTPDPEYLAVFSPDNEFCFFTRRFDETSRGSLIPRNVEKFMVAKKESNGEFNKGEPMYPPFNQNNNNNEGGATISKDNRTIYFTRNDNGNFDIYYSEFYKEKWSEIKNIGNTVNDPKQWDSQPTLSSDGKTLYFASYRDSVFGTCDILKTVKNNGTFTVPERLSFNTNGNEKSPFIHPDNKTLYFSSDSLPGMGGLDIYMVKKDEKNNWGKPVNLGYPINTEADEVGFFVSTDGKKGYFASNQLSGAGGYDIYSFDLPVEKRPDKVLFVKGQVRGDNDEIPLAAKIELRNLNTSEVFDVDYDTLTGNYASVVLFDADYIMTVKKEGHAYNSQYFSEEDSTIKGVVTSDLDVRKMAVGTAYKLNNILFETNSSELNKASQNIIADFAEFLKSNPKVEVSIHGHTDSEGGAESNMKLSDDRAHAVYDWLIRSGINAKRISYKGFGQTKPLVPNDTEEGKAQNRRTEFVIINK